MNHKSNGYGIKRIVSAFVYSWKGLRAAFKYEAAFRQELILILVTAPLFWLSALTWGERALLIGSNLLLLLVELLNSAIETTVDLVTQQKQELAGRAKDLGSAAVLMVLGIWCLTWGVITVPHLWNFL